MKPDELAARPGFRESPLSPEALAPVVADACPSGEVVSAGDAQLNAGEGTGEARATFGTDGSGVTVGILSDSFDQATEAADGSGAVKTHALEDKETGDLPGPATPARQRPGGRPQPFEPNSKARAYDEGRAMAQIVHDPAPGAALDFASAFNGEESFAENIEALAEAGTDVIADDVFYLGEPFFQEGPVARCRDEAVEGGATYLSAAGNDNLFDAEGNEIASWETPAFRDAGGCPQEVQALPTAVFNGSHCMDFDPGAAVDRTFGIRVKHHEPSPSTCSGTNPGSASKRTSTCFCSTPKAG